MKHRFEVICIIFLLVLAGCTSTSSEQPQNESETISMVVQSLLPLLLVGLI